MPFISQLTPQITDIIKHWNDILLIEKQKKSIDHLIPIIQTASIINFLQPDPDLKKELDNFKKIFSMLFSRSLDHVGDYRFENARLEKIKNIELKETNKNGLTEEVSVIDYSIETKRRGVLSLFDRNPEDLIKFRQKIISQNVFDSFSLYKKANISFNYGTFYKTLLEELSKTSDKYNSTLNEILKSENIQDYTSNLLKLNDMLEIDQNFDILKEKLKLDPLQIQDLLTNMIIYRSNVDPSRKIDYILHGFYEDIKTSKIPHDYTNKMRFFFENISQVELKKEELQEPLDPHERGKKILKDLQKITTKNALHGNLQVGPIFLITSEEFEIISSDNKYLPEIEKFLLVESKKFPEKQEIFTNAIKNLKLLTNEEILFLDLFFLNREKSQEFNLVYTNIFDYRDNKEEKNKKFLEIVEDIATKGGFYPKLDMKHKTEFSLKDLILDETKQTLQSESRNKNFQRFFGDLISRHDISLKYVNTDIESETSDEVANSSSRSLSESSTDTEVAERHSISRESRSEVPSTFATAVKIELTHSKTGLAK